ncbi:hypothetical protein [Sporosarcina sp. P1]|uniref:hypothetical protein n=1 Tax=Sporosarcina sp. P1 TaxID=2048257 RepID=UPI000C6498E7|nr:hypothetical protein [Sporosarcina sp. P1]PIC83064.1 hypothetical protein CSV73_08740 [Sporosarcina sp. P1]
MKYELQTEQMKLLVVKEETKKPVPAKRVDIVSLRMVKESCLLYKNRSIKSLEDGFLLFKQFLGELDREYFVLMCLDVLDHLIIGEDKFVSLKEKGYL